MQPKWPALAFVLLFKLLIWYYNAAGTYHECMSVCAPLLGLPAGQSALNCRNYKGLATESAASIPAGPGGAMLCGVYRVKIW